ncbi:hypothetical protein JG688_00003000 [Phytophthora aleatoria]|uniref:Uncharacterized protein n=1 Tax=Phytophthora aleatoria TaxID=2496075 RepID=A0A8J5MCD8_9STRA|nr:hypothetical protein JG688_00003000 [Phytophthora aleatoria]
MTISPSFVAAPPASASSRAVLACSLFICARVYRQRRHFQGADSQSLLTVATVTATVRENYGTVYSIRHSIVHQVNVSRAFPMVSEGRIHWTVQIER